MSYIDKIKERARLDKKTIVLPESNDKQRRSWRKASLTLSW